MKYKKEILGLRKVLMIDIKTAADVLNRVEGDVEKATELYKNETTLHVSKELNIAYDVVREILETEKFDTEKSKSIIRDQVFTISQKILTDDKLSVFDKMDKLNEQIVLAARDLYNNSLELKTLNSTRRSIFKAYNWARIKEDLAESIDEELTSEIIKEIEFFDSKEFLAIINEAIEIKRKLEAEVPRTKSFVVKLRLHPDFKRVEKKYYRRRVKFYKKIVEFALTRLNELP